MKRIISVLTVLSLLFALTSCGKKGVSPGDKEVDDSAALAGGGGQSVVYADELATDESDEGRTEPATQPQISARNLLTYYYNGNYNPQRTGKYIADFDGDGTEEMIVSEYVLSQYNTITACKLYLLTVSGGIVRVSDTYAVSNEAFPDDRMFIEINEENKDNYLGQYRQSMETWVSGDGVASMNIANGYQGTGVHYFLIKAGDGKLTVKQHLLDPGYTSGTGLYYYDGYSEQNDSSILYAEDERGDKSGKYSSYSEAINDLIGVYGFTFEENSSMGKYSVKQADGIEKINSYSTFSDLISDD